MPAGAPATTSRCFPARRPACRPSSTCRSRATGLPPSERGDRFDRRHALQGRRLGRGGARAPRAGRPVEEPPAGDGGEAAHDVDQGLRPGRRRCGRCHDHRDHDRAPGRGHALGRQPGLLPHLRQPHPRARARGRGPARAARRVPRRPGGCCRSEGRCLMATKFDAIMARRGEIMRKALGMDYSVFEQSPIAFDYEGMMSAHGKGARIFVKDEAANMAGAFKDRRASVSIHVAKEKGYEGVIAATSGNYGAAVSSQAARYGLKCIICQETFDSRHIGQPEIVEKSRICEAFGAEVVQMTVGPELFFHMVELLDITGYFAASLYSSFGVSGIETLGLEIANEMTALTGAPPTHCVITHAGGGNTTGTARGLKRAGATDTHIISASVDLSGLHMASDDDFNRKSFTTGHTGFGVPFATWPDRADVPRNAARSLRYIDRYLTVTQGEVFYITEAMSKIEGLERGPAGNTAMAAATNSDAAAVEAILAELKEA